jgi:SNF2 family DNA or RNA helicase
LLVIHLYAVVLCPLSVTDGWVSEIDKFTPKLKVLRYVGEKEHRRSLRKTIHEHVKESPSSSNVSLESCNAYLLTGMI